MPCRVRGRCHAHYLPFAFSALALAHLARCASTILRRHLVEKVPVSTVCEEAAIPPSQFYLWHKQFFQNGAAGFQLGSRSKDTSALVSPSHLPNRVSEST